MPLSLVDEQFRRRIESAVALVQAWEDATDEVTGALLLRECRNHHIPTTTTDHLDDFVRPEDDHELSPEMRYLQKLARYFQSKMTWINTPPCRSCGNSNTTKHQGTRGPESEEERKGQAGRVEVYRCDVCQEVTTFPRYNAVQKLLQTHSGRCGEYANLFGLYCRSLGLETRYILDSTDHVWTEVYVHDSWIMIDSCEGVIDENSMYEAGWGKKLSYVVAVSISHVQDVTPKYTRKFHSDDFQTRRRGITSSEQAGQQVLNEINQKLREKLSAKEIAKLDRRLPRENRQLEREKNMNQWEHRYGRGRISGSLAWKSSRNETGNVSSENSTNHDLPVQFHVETYCLVQDKNHSISIALQPHPPTRHEAILVNGVPCSVGAKNSLSVVVLDERYLGCILQSRCFVDWVSLAQFVVTIPAQRIVVMVGKLSEDVQKLENHETATRSKLSQLGKFQIDSCSGDGILYVGQVLANPDWAYCCSFQDAPNGFVLEGKGQSIMDLQLRTVENGRPASVIGRIPEDIMPLVTQKMANFEQKRQAFLSYTEKYGRYSCGGYTTKKGAPVYLMGRNAYPFSVDESNSNEDGWTSFLLLPPVLVPEDDKGKPEAPRTTVPRFEIPLETNFFVRSLGAELLVNTEQKVSTVDVLRNTRLVAFYFSAHWCGPCRSFTPMLVEMYHVLKESHPTHGLEIVFVSSDRDQGGFIHYFSSMPWLAIPFDSLALYKPMLSMNYGVRGIPSLVVLDSMSGQVVVPNDMTRQQIMNACRGGDDGIISLLQDWIDRVPPETKQLVELLTVSCHDDTNVKKSFDVMESYIVRGESIEAASRVTALVRQLVSDGMDVEDATAAALAVEEVSADTTEIVSDTSPLNGLFTRRDFGGKNSEGDATSPSNAALRILNDSGRNELAMVLSTMQKYLDKYAKSPWSPLFRHFQLSFKVADRITQTRGGLELLHSLGFRVYGSDEDFFAEIPVYAHVDAMLSLIKELSCTHCT